MQEQLGSRRAVARRDDRHARVARREGPARRARARDREAPGDLIAAAPGAAGGGRRRRRRGARRLRRATRSDAPAAAPATARRRGARRAPSRARALRRALRVRVTGRVASAPRPSCRASSLSRARRGVLWSLNDSGNTPAPARFTTAGRDASPRSRVSRRGERRLGGHRGRPRRHAARRRHRRQPRPAPVGHRLPRARAAAPPAPSPVRRGALRAALPRRRARRRGAAVRPLERLDRDRLQELRRRGGVYVARRPSSRQVTTLRRAGTIRLGDGEAVTAGDVRPTGARSCCARTTAAFVWRRRAGETVAAALRRRPCRARRRPAARGAGRGARADAATDARSTRCPRGRGRRCAATNRARAVS